MDAVEASVASRKSVKINNNNSLMSFRSEFDSSAYSSKSVASTKHYKKIVRIENDPSKFPLSSKRNKITYDCSSEKISNETGNHKKKESQQCLNIISSPQNRRKIVTMLNEDVHFRDSGSMRSNKQQLGTAKKIEKERTAEAFIVNNSKIKTYTKHENVNGGKCDKGTARKPIIAEGNIKLTLIKSKELPKKVPNKVSLPKKLLSHETVSINNTVKNTNSNNSPERLECNSISLTRRNVVEKRNDWKNEPSEILNETTNVGFTSQNKETIININYFENQNENRNKKTSPRELIIPPFTIKTKECNKILNLNTDKFQNGNTSPNEVEVNELSLTNNAESYSSVNGIANATCVSEDRESKSQILDCTMSASLPNHTVASQLQSLQINSKKDTNASLEETTLIIERSIVSFSTNQNVCINHTGTRPFNIMSVLRKQLEVGRNITLTERNSCNYVKNTDDQIFDVHKSSFPKLSTDKIQKEKIQHESALIKLSDILKEMSEAQDIFNSIKYFSTKFKKEVIFLDSFIQSLQSLDTSTVGMSITNNNDISRSPTINRQHGIENKMSDENQRNYYTDNFGTNPSKSICWLNLLIGDEYQRAKNLLFILKLREDALKDLSRSQILWLESKKKNDYNNVCMLKKKQRGVLLKLQQECGEMHRIKKILLDITEKRNACLMQNKRNIGDKIFKSCDLEVLYTHKKILRRLQPDRSRSPRHCSPLKCFNLSGISYTDDSTELKQIECNTSFNNIFHINASIQYSALEKNGESGNKDTCYLGSMKNICEDKDFILVDGTYLNILFKKLNLPEIFSHGKEYDVHSTALQGLINSVNRLFELDSTTLDIHNDNSDIITNSSKLIENTSSKNTSPSTARSLVEEFGDFFDFFTKTNNSFTKNDIVSSGKDDKDIKCELNQDFDTQMLDIENNITMKSTDKEHESSSLSASLTSENNKVENDVETACSNYCDLHIDDYNTKENIHDHLSRGNELPSSQCTEDIQQYVDDSCKFDKTIYDLANLNDTYFQDVLEKPDMENCQTCVENSIDILEDDSEISQPGDIKASVSEAEALRMKQLAIELEIKALEQQSQLTYCIREIPDKPPPPYTPPTSETIPKDDITDNLSVSDKFVSRRVIEEQVHKFYSEIDKEAAEYELTTNQRIQEGESDTNIIDMCHEFVRDYCKECINKYKARKSDFPWDCGNILPIDLPYGQRKVKSLIITDICDIIVYNPEEDICKSIQEFQMKRYDYIEEILFAEWKKCEKEWTSLESNEISVKNQLVDIIIVKELDEMLEEYLQFVSYGC